VIVSDRARQMLAGHIHFLAQKSPTAARKVKSAAIVFLILIFYTSLRCIFSSKIDQITD
jgi:hypothetical protein